MIWFSFLLCVIQTQCKNFTELEFFNALVSTPHAIIIDVQKVEHYEKCHIINASHAPTKESLLKMCDTLGKDAPIFIYCTRGERSLTASNLLVERGFTEVINLKCGLETMQKNKALEKYLGYIQIAGNKKKPY